ncbi:MAG: HesA/MoeB/ThiF family protein [Brumimicrobium sp.]|nr:HesA/MoeB/ThiF family protein [Brumimicrobium sp.]
MFTKEEKTYYKRQLALHQFGAESQVKLKSSRVLVVGAGGLASSALQYLVGAGIGHIGIADGDSIELHNLHRQTLYDIHSVGKKKVEVAKEKLQLINPHCTIKAYPSFLSHDNILDIITDYDVIVDCTDNFTARYLINDACILLDKPFVYGAIYRYEGQVSVFNYQNGPTYRCLFPEKEENKNILNCNEDGVLGILPGIIGIYQAMETIKMITGIGSLLNGQILLINILNNQSQRITIQRKNIPYKELLEKSGLRSESIACSNFSCQQISWNELENIKDFIFLDVRNHDEQPKLSLEKVVEIPLLELEDKLDQIPSNKNIVCVCKSGIRSERAISILEKKLNREQLFNLQNGITNEFLELWKRH